MDMLQHRDFRYATPRDLRLTPTAIRRALVVGSCATGPLSVAASTFETACPIDFFNVNHGCMLPEQPPEPVDAYDFQIIQIPIRTILPESRLMRLAYDDLAGHQALLDDAFAKLEFSIANSLRWTREAGLPAFVCNFAVPQQNPYGRFMPRYDIRNIVHMVELLNLRLDQAVAAHRDAYLLDLDQLSALFGRKFAQDDATSAYVHGAFLNDYDALHDQHRLEPVPLLTEQYGARTHEFIGALWEEAVAMFRTLRQTDAVKLVIVDLDDTLWRGVVAEGGAITSHTTEGWPLGFVEALLYLKRRGVLLAIVSKNDRGRVEALWPDLYGGRLELSDFAAVRINWSFKASNIAEVLAEVNLLPRNVVFVDDNPVERAAVQDAFPDIRVLGANPYHFRRIMLWSPELQVPSITAESMRRTEMVQAQAGREAARRTLSRDDFLAGVAPKVALFALDPNDPRFVRAFELLNKTNQFNSTGIRWTAADCTRHLDGGGQVLAFEVEDKYTKYGLVGVLLLSGDEIVQFVMSCRVLGLDVEIAVLAELAQAASGGLSARMIETDANLPIRDLWTRAGFSKDPDGLWRLHAGCAVPRPGHVVLSRAHVAPAPMPDPATLIGVDQLPATTADSPAPAPPEPADRPYAPGSAWDVLTRRDAVPASTQQSDSAAPRRRRWLAGLLNRR